MKLKSFIATTFLLFTFISSYAQWSIGFGMAGECPVLDFNSGYREGLGYSLTVLSKPFPEYNSWKFQVGGNLNHFWTGSEKENIALLEPQDATAKYKIRNTATAISLKGRAISYPRAVRYHIDLDLGYRGFSTQESFTLNETDTLYENRTDSMLSSSGNVFLGLTTGIMFRISPSFYIDVYSRFDYGLRAKWYNLESFEVKNDIPQYHNYEYKSTHTPILWVGVTASFNIGKKEKSEIPTYRPSSGNTNNTGTSTRPTRPPRNTENEDTESKPDKPKPKPLKPKPNSPKPPIGPM